METSDSSSPLGAAPASPPSFSAASAAELGSRQLALELMDELRAAMLRALEVLHAVRALFELKPGATRGDFARFVHGALERLPELQALEWIARVPGAERAAHEASARAGGVADYAVRVIDAEGRLVPAPEAEEHWPVFYVEPTDENAPVLGLDLRTEPCRRAALERAARTGLPVATTPLNLAQLGPRQLGFFVVLAVRDPAAAPDAAPFGWTLAVFRVQRLVERVFAPLLGRGVHLSVCDRDDAATPPFTTGASPLAAPAWRHEQEMPIAGRTWRFTFSPGPGFCADDAEWARGAASALGRANELLSRCVAERTAELAARGAALEEANRELRAEAARRESAEAALAQADARLSVLSEAEARQWGLAGLVGRSPRFSQVIHQMRSLQAFPKTNVLLTGESGTGKELLARAIHYGGALASGAFVPVNCSALPADQAELLLFGQVRGPHVGSTPERKGAFELAHGGTLFLDEIGDMPVALQARLLRVLEDGAIQPIGATAARTVQVRIIAATHVDLPARVATGAFRQDLYYRLMHFHLQVPPLRERLEDVPALAQHFVRMLSTEQKRPAPALRPDAFQRLLAHAYPGNIRELKNTIERAIIYAGDDEIRGHHIVFAPAAALGLSPETGAGGGGVGGSASGLGTGAVFDATGAAVGSSLASAGFGLGDLPLNLAAAEDQLIARAIAVAEGNLSQAARLLGINRASLYRWQQRRETSGGGGTAESAAINVNTVNHARNGAGPVPAERASLTV